MKRAEFVGGQLFAATAVYPSGVDRRGATLWVRTGVRQSMSASLRQAGTSLMPVPVQRHSGEHEGFLIERLVAVVAEILAAFAAWRGTAFCQITEL